MSTNTRSIPISTKRRRPRRDTSIRPMLSMGTWTRRPSALTRMAMWRRFRLLNRPNLILRSLRNRGRWPAVRRVYQQWSSSAPCPIRGAVRGTRGIAPRGQDWSPRPAPPAPPYAAGSPGGKAASRAALSAAAASTSTWTNRTFADSSIPASLASLAIEFTRGYSETSAPEKRS